AFHVTGVQTCALPILTNIGHFRAASKLLEGKRDIPVKLWVAPPTKMDAQQLTEEGHYGVFGTVGARTEMPGCSLCMGNQAQVREIGRESCRESEEDEG